MIAGLAADEAIPALLTAIVFLAGFASLRMHYSFAERRKVFDDVVSSVTGAADYRDKLRVLNQSLANAVNSPGAADGRVWSPDDRIDWKLSLQGRELAQLENPALSDADLAASLPTLMNRPSKSPADVVAYFIMLLVFLLNCALSAVVLDSRTSNTAVSTATKAADYGSVVVVVGWLVLAVMVLDAVSLSNSLRRLISVAQLRAPTATEWEVVDGASLPQVLAGISLGDVLSEYLGRPDDRLRSELPRKRTIDQAAMAVPGWATPHALDAIDHYERSRSSALRAGSAELARAWASSRQAVQMNPFDIGSRTVLAAVTTDMLLADLLAVGRGELEVSDVLRPLAFSDVISNDDDDQRDQSRPRRWRFSVVVRTAREAAVLVERRWGAVSGLRAAGGQMSELDRVATDFQLARAYTLSSLHDPSSDLSRDDLLRAEAAFMRVESKMADIGASDRTTRSEHIPWAVCGIRPCPLLVAAPAERSAWLVAARQVLEAAKVPRGAILVPDALKSLARV